MAQEIRITRLGPAVSRGCYLLWRALRRLRWSQNELARRLGVDSGVVARWLHGDKRPSARYAALLAKLVGVAVDAWHQTPPKSFALKATGTDG